MKYFLQGDQGTGRRVLEKIKSPLQLFNHLRGRCLLSRDNILFLQAMLYHARRVDLYNKLTDFAKDRGDILHCYPETENPVNGYKHVKFHVEGKKELHRQNIEEIRAIASVYLNVPKHFVIVQGIEATQSFLITFMVPEECYECLCNIGPPEKKTLNSIGVDYIIVGERKIELRESSNETVSTQGLQLNEELNYYFKQNAALQKKIEQYQLRELRACKPQTGYIWIMSSLTILATFLFNIVQGGKNYLQTGNTVDSANRYFRHIMSKIKAEGYDKELIGSLLEAHRLVIRKTVIEEYRLIIDQHKWHIQFLEHMNRISLYTQNKLKYLLGKDLKESVLSENEEYFLYYMINAFPTRIDISHVIVVGGGIEISQLRPYLDELAPQLNENDKQKLRQAFGVKSVVENTLLKQNVCFIEILMVVEAERCGGNLNIEDFGDKLLSVINRKEFEEQWRYQMEKFYLKHKQQQQKTGTQTPSESKSRRKSEPPKGVKSDEVMNVGEISNKLEIIMKKMAQIESLVQHPFVRLDPTQLGSFGADIHEMPKEFKETL